MSVVVIIIRNGYFELSADIGFNIHGVSWEPWQPSG